MEWMKQQSELMNVDGMAHQRTEVRRQANASSNQSLFVKEIDGIGGGESEMKKL